MNSSHRITSGDDPLLDELCQQLRDRSASLDRPDAWPAEQLGLLAQYGVYEWFTEEAFGGQDWPEVDILRGFMRLSAACLTTTFVSTQLTGAVRRIATSENQSLAAALVPDLVQGNTFATVGISHLTTSRQHLRKPVLVAQETDDAFILNGLTPWVTGAVHAQTLVAGATCESGEQVLLAVPMNTPGVLPQPPANLIGLSASQTGGVRFERARVSREFLLAGPARDLMTQGSKSGTGGLQTSALALGLSAAAIGYLNEQARLRPDLREPTDNLRVEVARSQDDLISLASGNQPCTSDDLRARANSLVLRSTQAALAAAKGTGYVVGHPAGRWCREALFFLVWSCPQPVMAANLCELAGLDD